MRVAGQKADKRSTSRTLEGVPSGRTDLDDLDAKILRSCQTDARLSFRQMAADLHVSTSTVASRVAKLERSRVIRSFSAVIDAQKLGFELTVLTEFLCSKGKLAEMEAEVAKLPGVCAVYDATGEIDGMAIAKFRDREELNHFTKRLLALPFIERTNTHLVLATVKEDFRVPI